MRRFISRILLPCVILALALPASASASNTAAGCLTQAHAFNDPDRASLNTTCPDPNILIGHLIHFANWTIKTCSNLGARNLTLNCTEPNDVGGYIHFQTTLYSPTGWQAGGCLNGWYGGLQPDGKTFICSYDLRFPS